MQCKQVEKLLFDYIEGDVLTVEETQNIKSHLASCRACLKELSKVREIKQSLVSFPDTKVPPFMLEKIKQKITSLKAKNDNWVQKAVDFFASFQLKLLPVGAAMIFMLAVLLQNDIFDKDYKLLNTYLNDNLTNTYTKYSEEDTSYDTAQSLNDHLLSLVVFSDSDASFQLKK